MLKAEEGYNNFQKLATWPPSKDSSQEGCQHEAQAWAVCRLCLIPAGRLAGERNNVGGPCVQEVGSLGKERAREKVGTMKGMNTAACGGFLLHLEGQGKERKCRGAMKLCGKAQLLVQRFIKHMVQEKFYLVLPGQA